ncbi:MAG: hypothetical protein QM731_01805 [Chitinophagaceae bacterium]
MASQYIFIKRSIPPVTPANKKEEGNLWSIFRDLVFAIGILLFFLGWFYLAYYFKNLGIDVYSIKIDVFTFYLYGFYTLLNWSTGITLGFYFLATVLLHHNRVRLKSFYNYFLPLTFLLFTIMLVEVKLVAENKIHSIIHANEEVPIITFSFKKEFIEETLSKKEPFNKFSVSPAAAERDSTIFANLLANSLQLYKIYENGDEIYALSHPPERDMRVFVINKKDLQYYYLTINPLIK